VGLRPVGWVADGVGVAAGEDACPVGLVAGDPDAVGPAVLPQPVSSSVASPMTATLVARLIRPAPGRDRRKGPSGET